MKTRIIRKLLTEQLVKTGIFPTHSRSFLLKTSASFVRYINTNSTSLERLLCVNSIQNRFNHRHRSRWAPNIIKSQYMNYSIPEGTLVENIWSRIDQWADKTALVCGITGREMKYHELQDLSKRIATSLLTDIGLSPGQVLATILPNMPEYPPLLLGAFEAGVVVTTMNPLFTADELTTQLKDSAAVAAVTFPDKLPTLMEAVSKLDRTDFKIIVTPNIDGSIAQNLPDNVIPFSKLISNNIDIKILDTLKPKSVSPDDTVLIPYSSGTTGKPKGVGLTHKNLMANNTNIRYLKYIWDTTKTYQDVVTLLLPIFHVYAFAVVLTTSLYSGAKIITLPKFEEATFLKALKDYKTTVLFLAPPLVLYLGNSPSVTKEHLSSVRLVVSGAAPLADSDINKFISKASKNLFFTQGYGLTETSPCICSIPEGMKPPNLNTVGIPAPNTQIKVTDLQTGQALGANEEGEIWVKGPQVMKGYLNNRKATEECIDEEGWFHTGDVGYYDEKGFFYITDRVKELIKVKGFQVAPSELEAVLRNHPDVQDAGVIGAQHPGYGETPIAFIQSKLKDEKILEEKLKTYLTEKLAKYKHASKFIFIDAIPKSASGKILRKDLKTIYLSLTGK